MFSDPLTFIRLFESCKNAKRFCHLFIDQTFQRVLLLPSQKRSVSWLPGSHSSASGRLPASSWWGPMRGRCSGTRRWRKEEWSLRRCTTGNPQLDLCIKFDDNFNENLLIPWIFFVCGRDWAAFSWCYAQYFNCLKIGSAEIWTRDCWVRSMKATSVLCRPQTMILCSCSD